MSLLHNAIRPWIYIFPRLGLLAELLFTFYFLLNPFSHNGLGVGAIALFLELHHG